MNAVLFGYVLGSLMTALAVGYLVLGLLWAIRAYKRWPRSCAAIGSVFAALSGVIAATVSETPAISIIPALVAAVFIAWRGKLFSRPA